VPQEPKALGKNFGLVKYTVSEHKEQKHSKRCERENFIGKRDSQASAQRMLHSSPFNSFFLGRVEEEVSYKVSWGIAQAQ
jgi:hypothetical protein